MTKKGKVFPLHPWVYMNNQECCSTPARQVVAGVMTIGADRNIRCCTTESD